MVETNVLIIGKSGVGKSSLINYLFNQNVVKTGTGKPVTEKGIFKEELKINDKFKVNLFDTWGLEANKSDEWEELIFSAINEYDRRGILPFFHSIFYCISAKSARIEEFELEIIRKLVRDYRKVIIILTHPDTNNVEEAISAITKELINIKIDSEDIIKVCSVEKKLLGGKSIKKFGKEEVLNRTKVNLWQLICMNLEIELSIIIRNYIDRWFEESKEYIKKIVRITTLKEDNSTINNLLIKYVKEIESESNKIYYKVYEDYSNLINQYDSFIIAPKKIDECIIKFNFNIELRDKLYDKVGKIISLVSPVGLLLNLTLGNHIRSKKLIKRLENTKNEIKDTLSIEVINQVEELMNLKLIK